MKANRRDFIKTSSLTGLGLAATSTLHGASVQTEKAQVQRFNMSGCAAPSLDKVRLAIIGLGKRGPAHVNILRHIEGVQIRALCDIRPQEAKAAGDTLTGTTHKPDILTGGEDWRRVCERDDIILSAALRAGAMKQMTDGTIITNQA